MPLPSTIVSRSKSTGTGCSRIMAKLIEAVGTRIVCLAITLNGTLCTFVKFKRKGARASKAAQVAEGASIGG